MAAMPMPRVPALTTVRDAAGDERLLRRPISLQPHPSLICPNGHRLKKLHLSLEEATFTCEHRLANGAVCDASIYVVSDWRGAGDLVLTLVVPVTRDEIARIRRMRMVDRLAYLGLSQEVRRADHAG